jgi:hypothetical protein
MGLKQKRDLLNLKGFIIKGLCLMFAFILEQAFLKLEPGLTDSKSRDRYMQG